MYMALLDSQVSIKNFDTESDLKCMKNTEKGKFLKNM